MSCERFRSELTDLALGAAASRGAEAHAASCPSCREALAAMRARVSLMDEELGLAGAAEPGPHFLSRVRARVAADRSARRPALRLLVPVLAGLLAVCVGLLLVRRQPVESPPQAASLQRPEPAPTAAAAAPSAPNSKPPETAAPAPRRPAERPAVLVDPSEGVALADLAARLDSGRARPESLQIPAPDSNDMKEIAIAPLDVRPLDAAPSLEDSTERSPS